MNRCPGSQPLDSSASSSDTASAQGSEPSSALAAADASALARVNSVEAAMLRLPANCAIVRSDGRWRVYTGGGAGSADDVVLAIERALDRLHP